MRPPVLETCPASMCHLLACPIDAMHTHILQAHEHGSRQGEPLLTAAGVSRLRELIVAAVSSAVRRKDSAPEEVVGPGSNQLLPRWDPKARQLWLSTRLLKTFRQPAPNQTLILDVFQEEEWTIYQIDDPLSRGAGEVETDARRRLHETIKNLNRGLPPGTIRFHGDGTGQGVRWEFGHGQANSSRKECLRRAQVTKKRANGRR
jgi:hypothetical protein